jgi:hypothetical protein
MWLKHSAAWRVETQDWISPVLHREKLEVKGSCCPADLLTNQTPQKSEKRSFKRIWINVLHHLLGDSTPGHTTGALP